MPFLTEDELAELDEETRQGIHEIRERKKQRDNDRRKKKRDNERLSAHHEVVIDDGKQERDEEGLNIHQEGVIGHGELDGKKKHEEKEQQRTGRWPPTLQLNDAGQSSGDGADTPGPDRPKVEHAVKQSLMRPQLHPIPRDGILAGEERAREILCKVDEPTSHVNPISMPPAADEVLATRMDNAVDLNAEVRRQPDEMVDINTELNNKLRDKYKDIIDGWPEERKTLFCEATQAKLPEITRCSQKQKDVVDSVVFDMSDDEKIQDNYMKAISHYRAWQLAGSDTVYEWPEGRPTFATRRSRTFVFWYRQVVKDVGLVIDGQTGWVWGFLRRPVVNNDPQTCYEALQFQDTTGYEYIVSKNKKEIIGLDGRYKGPVCDMTLGDGSLREALFLVCRYQNGGKVPTDTMHKCSDLLILCGPEAGKNNLILEYTWLSLVEDELRIPWCLCPLATKYDKVSKSTLKALGGSAFEAVEGVPLKSLSQCVGAFPILKRTTCSPTKLFLPDCDVKDQPRHTKISKGRNETTEESGLNEFRRQNYWAQNLILQDTEVLRAPLA